MTWFRKPPLCPLSYEGLRAAVTVPAASRGGHRRSADGRNRTFDVLFIREVLLPLSYAGKKGGAWRRVSDSNRRRSYPVRLSKAARLASLPTLQAMTGGTTRRCDNARRPSHRLPGHTGPERKTRKRTADVAVYLRGGACPARDSNPQPPAPKAGASANWATRACSAWTTSVSNRAGAVCKTALHTCAQPAEKENKESCGFTSRFGPVEALYR